MKIEESRTVFSSATRDDAEVAVGVSLYNYESVIVDCLDSVLRQDLKALDLIVVEDRSTDASLDRVRSWLERNKDRFGRCALIQHSVNSGLSAARNTAFNNSEAPYVFVLDADNLLYPRCVGRCLEVAKENDAAIVYPIIEKFGDDEQLMGTPIWKDEKFAYGNYIDAMALISRDVWRRVDGYLPMRHGWEDYDFWLKCVEAGYFGIQVPEILARYRVHETSMLRSVTNLPQSQAELRKLLRSRYKWLKI